MTLDEYQDATNSSAKQYPTEKHFLMRAVELCEEAAEVAQLIKREVKHGEPFKLDYMREELGDVLWQVAALAADCGLSLDDIARANLTKLAARDRK